MPNANPNPLHIPCTTARQDAAPPEAERHLLHNRCVASGGAASSRAPSAFPAFAFFASPPLRSLRCSLRIPGRATRPPKTFPTIGNIFSIHWKTAEFFFQSLENPAEIFHPLEKNFPIIGKIRLNFPTIGKKLSNHWKTFSAPPTLRPSAPPREHPSRFPVLSALLCFPSSSLPPPFVPFVSFVAKKPPPSPPSPSCRGRASAHPLGAAQ